MPYIGKGANGFGIRETFQFTATSGQQAFTSTDINSKTLSFDNGSLVDVLLNGVMLKPTTDYNTSTTNTITLTSGASASDEVMIIVYDVFSLSDAMPKTGGTFSGDVSLPDNVKAKFGTGNDLQIYHDGSKTIIDEDGTGALEIKSNRLYIRQANDELMADFRKDQYVRLYYDNTKRFETTSTGIEITGNVIIGTSGNGIDFSAVANASGMTSELLDSYETGTWTPSWNTGFSAIAYAQQYGRYVKIGSQVFAQFWILTHASNTVTTNGVHASMAGFPFTIGAVSDSQDQFARGAGNVGFQNHNGNVPSPYGINGETRIEFYYSGSTAWIHAGSGNAHNSKYFIGGFTYTVDM